MHILHESMRTDVSYNYNKPTVARVFFKTGRTSKNLENCGVFVTFCNLKVFRFTAKQLSRLWHQKSNFLETLVHL